MWHSLGPTPDPCRHGPSLIKMMPPTHSSSRATCKPRAEWAQPTGSKRENPWARDLGNRQKSEAPAVTPGAPPAPGLLAGHGRRFGEGAPPLRPHPHAQAPTHSISSLHVHVPLPTHACEKGFHQITKCAHPFPLGPQCITHGIRRYHGRNIHFAPRPDQTASPPGGQARQVCIPHF